AAPSEAASIASDNWKLLWPGMPAEGFSPASRYSRGGNTRRASARSAVSVSVSSRWGNSMAKGARFLSVAESAN
ncbi:MAG: hypothetical protein COW56_10895, partial [Rhodocyclales bacterium CG17_big_fil_post_rev_8_21_14_2_50_68_7]